MKNILKKTFIFILLFLFFTSVYSLSLGFRIGSGFISTTPGSEFISNKVGYKFNCNFSSEISLSKIFSLQPEIFFTYNNLQYQCNSQEFGNGLCNINLMSLDIPLLIKSSFEINKFTLGFFLGELISFPLSYQTYKDEVFSVTGNFFTPSVNLGITIGSDFNFKLGPGVIYIDLRYNQFFLDSEYYFYNQLINLGKLFSADLSFGYKVNINKHR